MGGIRLFGVPPVMNRSAETQCPIHDTLRLRWSPRAFADRPVEPSVVGSLLEAARWAPSCYGEEPWAFLVAMSQQPAEHERMVQCLVEGNQAWAKSAPVLMVSLAKKIFAHNGKPNAHAWHDVGLAVSQLTVQAMAMDLYVHQMGGIHREKICTDFNVPDEWEPVAGIAIGYLGDPASLPGPLQERENAPRKRKPLEGFVFSGLWGEPARAITDLDG